MTATPSTPHGLNWALFALAMGGLGIGIGEFAAMGLLPDIAGGVGTTIPQAGQFISAYALGVVVGAPLIAAFGARLRRRALLVGLMTAFALGNVVSALAPDHLTLLVARFLSGLPHGAYFGVASLVAAELAGPARRARGVARVMLGLAVANVAGVPAATWLGQMFGWRSAFVAVALVAVATVLCLVTLVPTMTAPPTGGVRRELAVLRKPQVLLILGVGSVGLGGMFAVYSYITPTLTNRAGMSAALVPLVLALWGLGMVVGNLIGGVLYDRAPTVSPFAILAAFGVFLALFAVVSTNPVGATVAVFLLGTGFALVPGLQTRLMDLAGDAQTVAAAANHAAFNIANASGAWLGGVALSLGGGWSSPAWVGVGLAAGGIVVLSATLLPATRRTVPA